jgi:hypothetical protein
MVQSSASMSGMIIGKKVMIHNLLLTFLITIYIFMTEEEIDMENQSYTLRQTH